MTARTTFDRGSVAIPTMQRYHADMRALAGLLLLTSLACGVAPIHDDKTPWTKPRWRYAGAHGRPLAWNGGVCADPASHEHDYPPSPRDAFQESPAGWKDTRATWPFQGQHAHRGRTCFREGRHMHLEAPDNALVFDDAVGAWRSPPHNAPRLLP